MFEQYKMVMVVRADLKMGKGKVAAQVRLNNNGYIISNFNIILV